MEHTTADQQHGALELTVRKEDEVSTTARPGDEENDGRRLSFSYEDDSLSVSDAEDGNNKEDNTPRDDAGMGSGRGSGVEASETKEGGRNTGRGSGHDNKDDTLRSTRGQGCKCCRHKAQYVMLVVLLFNTLVLAFYLAMHTTNMLDDIVDERKMRSWLSITPTIAVLAGILCSVGLGNTFWICVKVKAKANLRLNQLHKDAPVL